MPKRMSDKMPDRMSDRMPDRMWDRMPERMPEYMTDRMPEYMPDRIPEKKYVPMYTPIECQNICQFGCQNTYLIEYQKICLVGNH